MERHKTATGLVNTGPGKPGSRHEDALGETGDFGIPARALEFLSLSVRLNRGELLAASEFGANTPADVGALTLEQFQQALGSRRAELLCDHFSASGAQEVRQT